MTSRGRARLGVLVPFTNTNLEPDMQLLRPSGVSMHFARMGGYDADKIPDDAQMQALGASDLDTPLTLLGGIRPDVVLYGCTSATLTHGIAFDTSLAANIHSRVGAKTVTAAGALVNALHALECKKIGFASPYVSAINDQAIQFLEDAGFDVVAKAEVAETLDNIGQGAMTPEDVFDLGKAADHDNAQAIVLSCTDMRSVEIINALEADIGKPVVTSNQAMIYSALSAVAIDDPIPNYGTLLERPRL